MNLGELFSNIVRGCAKKQCDANITVKNLELMGVDGKCIIRVNELEIVIDPKEKIA
jgi:hypothetical protein